ncbi:hypothetical protein DVA86_27820 [Streptomyces armeniacus]|uniref:Resolvase/invertase-type recombinase catalytic domain-containing protein n=1 Tax=Streptomyces armeniacus TaxID=83291 RepID=A0A345XW50_9ACTN|nr:hypothetical protein [Streptomyces armeniacus]AXK35866.1 hypothetical protein DVA86_27820 [Streptomyces armeniacus]
MSGPRRLAVLYICHGDLPPDQVLAPLIRYARARGRRTVAHFAEPVPPSTPLTDRKVWANQVLPFLNQGAVDLLIANSESELASTDDERAALRLTLLRLGVEADYRFRPPSMATYVADTACDAGARG